MIRTTLALAFLLLNTSVTAHAGINANEIIRMAESAKGADIDGFIADLHIRSEESGEVRERWLSLKVGNTSDGESIQSLVEFSKPRKYKGQMLLMAKGNMWFIRRGLSKPIPISPRQRMMGGAANGDIATTNYLHYYDHKLLKKETQKGKEYFVFELNATSRLATYSRILYWISADELLGKKAEFYTASGKLFKTAEFSYDNYIDVKGVKRPFISSMTIHDDIQKGDSTVMTYDDIRVQSIPASNFNVNVMVR